MLTVLIWFAKIVYKLRYTSPIVFPRGRVILLWSTESRLELLWPHSVLFPTGIKVINIVIVDNYTNFVYSIGVSHTRSTNTRDEMRWDEMRWAVLIKSVSIKWVEHEKCLKWFHQIWVGLKLTNHSAINFVCKKCCNWNKFDTLI